MTFCSIDNTPVFATDSAIFIVGAWTKDLRRLRSCAASTSTFGCNSLHLSIESRINLFSFSFFVLNPKILFLNINLNGCKVTNVALPSCYIESCRGSLDSDQLL